LGFNFDLARQPRLNEARAAWVQIFWRFGAPLIVFGGVHGYLGSASLRPLAGLLVRRTCRSAKRHTALRESPSSVHAISKASSSLGER
jgi:hypothetical protein